MEIITVVIPDIATLCVMGLLAVKPRDWTDFE